MVAKKSRTQASAPHALLKPLVLGNTLVQLALIALVLGSDRAMMAGFQEDDWGEWATFWAFALAGVIALVGLRRAMAGKGEEKLAHASSALLLAGLAAFCIAVAGEEISWGQRLLGFAPPEVFLARNYQQELNFHNFLKTIGFDVKWLVAAVAFLYGVSCPFLAKEKFLERSEWGRQLARLAPPMAFVPFYLAVVVLLIVQPHVLSDEVAELLLGLAFASDLALRVCPRDLAERRSAPAAALLMVVPILLGIVSAPLADAVVSHGEESRTAQMRAELPRLGADLSRAQKGESPIEHVHARLYSVAEQQVLVLPEAGAFARTREREDNEARGRYWLDPWNNAYWLFAPTLDGNAIVYSFGANRRRDATPDDLAAALRGKPGEAAQLPGDDEGVRVKLGE